MDKLFVIKIGGVVIDDEKKLYSFLEKFASIEEKKILVHGGGKMATRLADQLKIPQQVVEGRRITDAETLKVVTMVYAGWINKNIVAQLQSHHCNAIGLTGADGDTLLAHRRKHPVIDFGFVGDIDSVNSNLINDLLERNLTPVFAPLTHDQQGQLLNTNADTISKEIAMAMSKSYEVKLIYSFEKAGVLLDANDEHSLIKILNPARYKELKAPVKGIANPAIFAGMIPKLDNAFEALKGGVKKVIIGKAEDLNKLLQGKAGTTIIDE